MLVGVADTAEGETKYSYDPSLDRLLWATHPAGLGTILPAEEFSYDDMGNRLEKRSLTIKGATETESIVTYTYDADTNELKSDGIYDYSYDANGNRISKTRISDSRKWLYEYDGWDRLVSVTEQTASEDVIRHITYRYDWAGRRIEKTVGDISYRYAFRGLNLVAEYDEDGELVAAYHHEPGTLDHPVSMERDGQMFYYHYDERGSVIQISNEHGVIVQRYHYDAFGNIVLQEGNMPNPFTYTGRHWDIEAGLYHYRARAYDPQTGTFLQHDPIFSANPYPYVSNNPINNTDQLGLREAPGTTPGGMPDRDQYYWSGDNYECSMVVRHHCQGECAIEFCKDCPTQERKDAEGRVIFQQRCTSSNAAPQASWRGIGCKRCWYWYEKPDPGDGGGSRGPGFDDNIPPEDGGNKTGGEGTGDENIPPGVTPGTEPEKQPNGPPASTDSNDGGGGNGPGVNNNNPINTGYAGWEAGLIGGYGETTIRCYDKSGNLHEATYSKFCLGAWTGVTFSGGAQSTSPSWSDSTNDNCTDDYIGWVAEFSVSTGQILGPGFEYDIGVSAHGVGGNMGILNLPFSSKVCYYMKTSDRIISK